MKAKKYSLFLALVVILAVMAIAIPVVPAAAAGSLILEAYSGPVNSYVTAVGSGFTGSNSFNITFGSGITFNMLVASGSVSGGSFTAAFLVPSFPRNTYSVTVTTDVLANSSSTAFTITPSIVSNHSSGKVGDQVIITGYGFSASQTVSGYFDNTVKGSAYTDISGYFSSLSMAIPETYKGNHAIKVLDNIGSSPTIAYTVNPSMTVSPTSVSIGDQISVAGKGFSASSQIAFMLDNSTFATSATTNANGSFGPTALTIPAVSAGTHTLKVTESSGAFLTATVTTSNSMMITPQSGPSGTQITVAGEGYEADKQITITFNGVAVTTNPSVIISNASGSFSAIVISPALPAGTYVISARDTINTGTANFMATSTISTGATSGHVGTSVPISGEGFATGGTIVIKFDDIQIASAKANNSGAFSTAAVIPPTKSGNHTVVITDGVNSKSFTFSVSPTAQFSPAGGNVGTDITVQGYSFNAGGSVSVKYDGSQVATASADSAGTFSVSFKAPRSTGGNHVVVVTDGNNTITSNFAMESTAPPAPALILPEKGAKADSLAKFQWQSVSDPSGVTYNFQVALDSAFSNPVINKTGLQSTGYDITEAEKLKSASASKPYYWRVQAVDGASNASPWSSAQTFVVGFMMPNWGWWLIIAVGAVIIFSLGFFLSRWLSTPRQYKTE